MKVSEAGVVKNGVQARNARTLRSATTGRRPQRDRKNVLDMNALANAKIREQGTNVGLILLREVQRSAAATTQLIWRWRRWQKRIKLTVWQSSSAPATEGGADAARAVNQQSISERVALLRYVSGQKCRECALLVNNSVGSALIARQSTTLHFAHALVSNGISKRLRRPLRTLRDSAAVLKRRGNRVERRAGLHLEIDHFSGNRYRSTKDSSASESQRRAHPHQDKRATKKKYLQTSATIKCLTSEER